MIDFDDLDALEDKRDEKLPEQPLFLVVQKFNVVRAAPDLQAAPLGTKMKGDCVAAVARRGHWLCVALGERGTETWMLEVGDPLGSPGERLLKPAPEVAIGPLRIGLRLAGTQALLQHHLFQLSGRKLTRAPGLGPVVLGSLAFGLEARYAEVEGSPSGTRQTRSIWSDREWRVFAMRPFKKGDLVERCELIPLRRDVALMPRGREPTSFELALLWQRRQQDHPPVAVFPSGYALLYRTVPMSNTCMAILNASWSSDGSALILKAPQDLEVGAELCLPHGLRDSLQCGTWSCLGLDCGPPEAGRPDRPAAAAAREQPLQDPPRGTSGTAGLHFRQEILQADCFLRAGLVRAGPSSTHGRGVFALGRIARNSTVEICPTMQLNQAGHLALLDFVMRFRDGDKEKIVSPLGCGMLYNHDDNPNVRWRCVPGVGGGMVVMTALRDIEEGEELFISYGKDYWSEARKVLESSIRPAEGWQSAPYHIAGSWNGYAPAAMEAFGDGLWRHTITLGKEGTASFQILFRGAWETAIYPSKHHANPFEDHELLGPDSGGHGINWTIGKHPKDASKPGTVYDIVLSVDINASPADVTWHRCVNGVPGHWT